MPPDFNAWRLTSLTNLPVWALLLAAGVLGVAVTLSWRGFRSEPSGARRHALFALRVLAAVLVFALLLEPGLELLAQSRVRARVAVLLDTSRSMSFPASPGGASRTEEMLKWLAKKQPELATLAARFQVDAYTFDKDLQPADVAKLSTGASSLSAVVGLQQGPSTDILGALTAAAQAGTGGRPLAGIVVASDGADNTELSDGVPKSAAQDLQRLGAPVFALPIGAAAVKDLAVERVRVDDFAFVRNQLTVDVTVTARGFSDLDVPVTLKREGQVVALKSIHLKSGQTKYDVKLQFVPDHTGKFAFSVSVPVYEGEALSTNNSRAFTLKVIRDRVRVLLVVGRPSWDVRFLRQLLKRDPNVDLISFFILRTPGDDTHSSQDELSLIPFPTTEIFQQQLKSFDLVIFQNFNHRPYRMSQYLDGIADYVKDGGAFAMIGGDQSFSAGDYAQTAIESILPAALLPPGAPPIDESFVELKLTSAGARHPMTELQQGAAQNQAAWARLPKLPGLNSLGSPKPGSQVLLEATDGRPVLVVGDAGRGRSLALTTDASWYWSFVAAGQELGPRAYETFWHAAIRWLVRDPALTPMRLSAEKQSFDPMLDRPALDAQVRGSDYGAAAGATLSIQITSADDGRPRAVQGGKAGPDGTAHLVLPALAPGAYKAVVTARKPDGGEIGEAEEAFVVAPTGAEMQRPAPRPDILQAIAEATSGKLIDQGDSLVRLTWHDPERVEVGQRLSKPLWDRIWVLLILCGVVGLEWTLRRRWGYA